MKKEIGMLVAFTVLLPMVSFAEIPPVRAVTAGARQAAKAASRTTGVAGARRLAGGLMRPSAQVRLGQTPSNATVLGNLPAGQFAEVKPTFLQRVGLRADSKTRNLLRPNEGTPKLYSFKDIYGPHKHGQPVKYSSRGTSADGIVYDILHPNPDSSQANYLARRTPMKKALDVADYAIIGVAITAEEATFLSHFYPMTLRRIVENPISAYESLDSWGEVLALATADSFYGSVEDLSMVLEIAKAAPEEYVLLTDFVVARCVLNMGQEAHPYLEQLAAFRAEQGWISRPVFEEVEAYAQTKGIVFHWPEPIEGKIADFVPKEKENAQVKTLFRASGLMDKLMRHWYPLDDLNEFLKLKNNIHIIIQ